MELIVFCGIQGSGKTTFYRERFFNTHLRISLDLVKTRERDPRPPTRTGGTKIAQHGGGRSRP